MNKLRAIWWLLDISLLAAAIISIGYAAVVGKVGDLLVSMAVTKHDSTSKFDQITARHVARARSYSLLRVSIIIVGTFTGSCLLASFILSLAAITRPAYRNKLLIAFTWTLVVNMCIATAVSHSLLHSLG